MFQLGTIIFDAKNPSVKYVIVDSTRTRYELAKPKQTIFERKLTLPMSAVGNGWEVVKNEIDQETVINFMNFKNSQTIKKAEAENKVRMMKEGQLFIGGDGKKYAFIKLNRTNLIFAALTTKDDEVVYSLFKRYRAKPPFVKEILEEIVEEEWIGDEKPTQEEKMFDKNSNRLMKMLHEKEAYRTGSIYGWDDIREEIKRLENKGIVVPSYIKEEANYNNK